MYVDSDAKIKELLEVKGTRIIIERFQRILEKEQYHIYDKRIFYFINSK